MLKLASIIVLYGFFANIKAAPSYPACPQLCHDSATFTLTDLNSLPQRCGPRFRTSVSICEAASCSEADRKASDSIDESLCASTYQANATLASAASAAIASSTPPAIEGTQGKDPTNLSVYPECAQKCFEENSQIIKTCGSFSNRQCICNTPDSAKTNDCQRNTCSGDDTIKTFALAYKLCAPIGGVQSNTRANKSSTASPPSQSGSNGTGSTGGTNTTATPPTVPSPSPFVSQASDFGLTALFAFFMSLAVLTLGHLL